MISLKTTALINYLRNKHFLVALDHLTNLVTLLSAVLDMIHDSRDVRPSAHNHHAHAHVEGPIHLGLGYVSDFLKQIEYWQHRPRAFPDFHRGAFGQNARNVIR